MKKQVLAIILKSSHHGHGGIENHVYSILKNIDKERYDIHLIFLSAHLIDDKFKDLKVKITKVRDDDISFKPFAGALSLWKILKGIRPDIVHLHGFRPIALGSVAAKLAGVRYIVSTLHSSYIQQAMDNHGRIRKAFLLLSKLMHWVGFVLSSRITIVAEALRAEVRESCRALGFSRRSILEKTITIHNGIALDNFWTMDSNMGIRKELGLDGKTLLVGTACRLDEPKKGVGIFLRAAKRIIQNGYDVHFIVVGDGHSETQLIQLSKDLSIDNRVHFLGYRADVPEVLSKLNIFVLPSLSEGFPLVNLEAMAAGLPVVATRVGGTEEAVVNLVNGCIVPPNDEISLSNAIMFLIEHPKIREIMGNEGKQRANLLFSEKVMVDRIIAVYSEISEKNVAESMVS